MLNPNPCVEDRGPLALAVIDNVILPGPGKRMLLHAILTNRNEAVRRVPGYPQIAVCAAHAFGPGKHKKTNGEGSQAVKQRIGSPLDDFRTLAT